ncbi:MAG: RNA polymerase sigma factor [Gammaproteobacteria bacterium]|nr:RNA polymerase sigma factor [Gammaproteobacteria bacterium]NND59465.1 RNA polymerase sigma factor [Gammaproteobacteria bacterium]
MNFLSRSPRPPGEQAFHAAIERGGDAWYAACLRITGDAAAAQDAVQDGLLRAWHRREQFRGGARLETWIHRITVNSALTLHRQRQPLVDDDHAPESVTPDPGPAEALAHRQLGTRLESALGTLSPMERTCFVLKHLEQWRLAEIATELDTAVGSVKQALFRATRKLRTQLPQLRSGT